MILKKKERNAAKTFLCKDYIIDIRNKQIRLEYEG